MPSQFGGLLVVARRRVVVKAVVGAFVEVDLIGDVVGLKRLFVGRPSGVDAPVEAGVVNQERRLDFGDVLDRGLP